MIMPEPLTAAYGQRRTFVEPLRVAYGGEWVKKQEFIEVKKNNYFREFLNKCEKMSLSVTAVIATGQFI